MREQDPLVTTNQFAKRLGMPVQAAGDAITVSLGHGDLPSRDSETSLYSAAGPRFATSQIHRF